MVKKRGYVGVYAEAEKKHMHAFQDKKDKFFSPLLKILIKLKVTPNMLSFSSVILAMLFIFFIQRDIRVSLAVLLAGLFFDTIDGSLARMSRKISSKGTFIDGFSDHTA